MSNCSYGEERHVVKNMDVIKRQVYIFGCD